MNSKYNCLFQSTMIDHKLLTIETDGNNLNHAVDSIEQKKFITFTYKTFKRSTKLLLLFIIHLTTFNSDTQAQGIFSFPTDSLTGKFTITEVVTISNLSKKELYENAKNGIAQILYQNFDNQGKNDVVKMFTITNMNNVGSDTGRLFYLVNVTNLSKKGMRHLVKDSYTSLMFHVFVYFKDEKYKIELTDFSVSSENFKIKGSVESVEKNLDSDMNWYSVKKKIFEDATYVKEKLTEKIATYITKSNF